MAKHIYVADKEKKKKPPNHAVHKLSSFFSRQQVPRVNVTRIYVKVRDKMKIGACFLASMIL
jgi:hypothetical protein